MVFRILDRVTWNFAVGGISRVAGDQFGLVSSPNSRGWWPTDGLAIRFARLEEHGMTSGGFDGGALDQEKTPGRPRLSPMRAAVVLLSLLLAIYFVWAMWVDAPVSKFAWLGFAAVQFFNAALLVIDSRARRSDAT
ncbi:MAG: hypothetical protein JWO25_2179 [Alphaproteobacteria bacterium]|nr:hypothetical protein [Alphaproteobacteria bacterium]